MHRVQRQKHRHDGSIALLAATAMLLSFGALLPGPAPAHRCNHVLCPAHRTLDAAMCPHHRRSAAATTVTAAMAAAAPAHGARAGSTNDRRAAARPCLHSSCGHDAHGTAGATPPSSERATFAPHPLLPAPSASRRHLAAAAPAVDRLFLSPASPPPRRGSNA